MITIYYAGHREEFVWADDALKRINYLKKQGYRVTWSCYDSEDNEYLWERVI